MSPNAPFLIPYPTRTAGPGDQETWGRCTNHPGDPRTPELSSAAEEIITQCDEARGMLMRASECASHEDINSAEALVLDAWKALAPVRAAATSVAGLSRWESGAYGAMYRRHDGRYVLVEDVESAPNAGGVVRIAVHELARLIDRDRKLAEIEASR